MARGPKVRIFHSFFHRCGKLGEEAELAPAKPQQAAGKRPPADVPASNQQQRAGRKSTACCMLLTAA